MAIPACPVQCFQYTVEYMAQKTCTNGVGGVLTTLDDLDDAMEAVSSLLEDPSTTTVLRRANGSSCTTLTYEIDVL